MSAGGVPLSDLRKRGSHYSSSLLFLLHKLKYISNDDQQNYHFCRLKLFVENFEYCKLEPTNQELIKSF